MSTPDESVPVRSPRDLLLYGLQALATDDWEAMRGAMHEDVVWDIPGHSPLAGRVSGRDAVVDRFRLMRDSTTGETAARLVAVLEGGDHAAAVQQNEVTDVDGTTRTVTAVTLVVARDGRLAALQYLVSDQDAVDALWSRTLSG